MKNLTFRMVTGVVLFLLLSSSVFAQKKIALVSFYCDKKIGGTGMGTVGESLMNDPNFNLKPLVDKSYDRFVNEFAKDFPFTLIDKAEFVSKEEYKNYQ